MPWDDEFESFSMFLHERARGSRAGTFFRPGECSTEQIAGVLAPHLGQLHFEVVEEPVPSGVGYVIKTREWLQTNVDRAWLNSPRVHAARLVRVYIEWLRRRASELEDTHAELLADYKKPD